MGRIRLHWDFFGPDNHATAVHFLKHVDQFCAREGISRYAHAITNHAVRCTAVLECDDQYLKLVRDALKPVRGERVLEE